MLRSLSAVSVAVVMAGLLVGCGGEDDPVAETVPTVAAPASQAPVSQAPASQVPSPASPPSPAASSPPRKPASPTSTTRIGTVACKLLGDAVRARTLAKPGVVEDIAADAGRSPSVFLKSAAGRLTVAYRQMQEDKGTAKEAAGVQRLEKRGADMLQTCRAENLSTK
jgi:hypothetical protein